MPAENNLLSLITHPREDIGVEYKSWINLNENHDKATLAKAAISLTNYGGGYIVIGFSEKSGLLYSDKAPDGASIISQDDVNAAIRRFALPEFHAETSYITHPATGVVHVVVSVPGGQTVPVVSKRDCTGVLAQNRCYVRKPGPRSEEPNNPEEWRELLNRCVIAQRENMLDAIRGIVTGRIETAPTIDKRDGFMRFVDQARTRWTSLVADLPADMPARFPFGWYEMAFELPGATPTPNLSILLAACRVGVPLRW